MSSTMILSIVLSLLIMNIVIGFIHIRIFVHEFQEYRSKGKVLIGQQKNILKGLATVIILLNEDSEIIKIKYSIGFSLFPEFREWGFLNNRKLADVPFLMTEIIYHNKKLGGAIKNALSKWYLFKQVPL
ncbi:MAG: transcriptional regulator GutM [Brevinema sp.]